MDAPDARPEFSRGATFEDLIELCRHLNEAGAKYVVIGGFAVIHYGFFRGTSGVDLPELLIKTKETIRPKDLIDKAYLQEFIERSKEPEEKKPWWRW